MYVPKVLSPRTLLTPDLTQSLSCRCSSPSYRQAQSIYPLAHTSSRAHYLPELPQPQTRQFHLRASISGHDLVKSVTKVTSSKKAFPYGHPTLNQLLEQLTDLQQDSQRFQSGFTKACFQLQYQIQSHDLKRQILGNQIAEVRIDLKQRQQDIQFLIEMLGSKEKLSSIADKSTDTEGSSSTKSSCSGIGVLSPAKSKNKRIAGRLSPKAGVKIFSRV